MLAFTSVHAGCERLICRSISVQEDSKLLGCDGVTTEQLNAEAFKDLNPYHPDIGAVVPHYGSCTWRGTVWRVEKGKCKPEADIDSCTMDWDWKQKITDSNSVVLKEKKFHMTAAYNSQKGVKCVP